MIDKHVLKEISIYYTTDSDYLDFVTDIDDKCHWNAIPQLNHYQGAFREAIKKNDLNITWLRNEVSGRYNTTLTEMRVKRTTITKAKELLDVINKVK